ncbi:MAG: GvpL/GvpF family gas vesicle protein [Chloroflexota bacterium]
MSRLGKYLYCVIRCSEDLAFEDVAPMGSVKGPVHTVCCDGLAMVASDSPVKEYENTRVNMLAHEHVLEKVMREYSTLPVRFGTVADAGSPTEAIRSLLRRRSQEFGQLLTDMEGKVELGLKALWSDEELIFEEIVAQNESIRRLRNSIAGKPPQATHFDRVRLGEMVKQALERKRVEEAAAILAPLRQLAHRTVENRVVLDRMVVNAAFLAEKRDEQEFDQAVNKLDERLGTRITFKYVGPVPPYNFVNIVVNWQEA